MMESSRFVTALGRIDCINEHLYISGYGPVQNGKLKEFGITCVVDATNIPNNPPKGNYDYVKVPVDDAEYANLEIYFDSVADKILDVKKGGGKTLVHCAAGVSRSASLCLVYLVKYMDMTLREAYLAVKEKRPIISPNSGFWRQMISYERSNKGTASVQMIHGSYRSVPDVYFAHLEPSRYSHPTYKY